MYDALVGVVIGVGEEDVPVFRQCGGVDGKPVILAGDEAALCSLVYARLVVTTVPVPEQEVKDSSHPDLIFNICTQNINVFIEFVYCREEK